MNHSNSQDWIRSLPPITSRRGATISQDIYSSLKTAIMAGRIGPGEHLVELILADQFQVSRVAVREALRRLANDGVVEIVPNRGVFTIQLLRSDIDEIFSLRATLESMAVRILCQRSRRSDFAILDEVVDDMVGLEKDRDRIQITQLDTRFHRKLVTLSEHKRLTQVWDNLATQISMVIYQSSTYYANSGDLGDRHRHLVQVMQLGDIETAVSEICAHLEGGKENLLLDFIPTGAANENLSS
jgi:DNA-binding GntR family transcriptional regulator